MRLLIYCFILTLLIPTVQGAMEKGAAGNFQEEVRAVWIHAGLFPADREQARADVVELLEKYRCIGVNHLFCFDPLPEQQQKGWDFLEMLVGEAHRRGLAVHPVVAPGYRLPEAEWRRQPAILIRGQAGEIYPHLNPADPGAREYVLATIGRLLAYRIDGIHLDYVRYPLQQRFSYDAATIGRFREETGIDLLRMSLDSGNPAWCEWLRWNAAQVQSLVAEVRALLNRQERGFLLSAAVFPDAEAARSEVGQYWPDWADSGLIDLACPMLYTDNEAVFRRCLKRALAEAGGKCRVAAGIACRSSHNAATPAGLARQVEIARDCGAHGVAIFSEYSLTEAFISHLAATVLRPAGK